MSADIVAQAIVAAAKRMRADPADVISDTGERAFPARVLAGVWLGRRCGFTRAARLLRIASANRLSPSMWRWAGVSEHDVEWIETELEHLDGAERLERRGGPQPEVAVRMPRPATRMERAPVGPAVEPASPRRASATVGKPAPRKVDAREAALGPHPADVAEHTFERRFVLRQRVAGVSWDNIAKMLGSRRSGADLKRVYEALEFAGDA